MTPEMKERVARVRQLLKPQAYGLRVYTNRRKHGYTVKINPGRNALRLRTIKRALDRANVGVYTLRERQGPGVFPLTPSVSYIVYLYNKES